MQFYSPPVADFRFLLTEVLDFPAAMNDIDHDCDVDLAMTVLETAGRSFAEQLCPLNSVGDAHGCRLTSEGVRTPPGFAEAYRAFVDAGWPSLAAAPEYGGQGLPLLLQLWLDEMLGAANLSFALISGLTRGACDAIAAHASPELKAAFLPRLIEGEWTGAMALTESGAGTDLALIRTRAKPLADGTFAITGTKIFISSGDNDLGSNVVHLVLARLPNAPDGIKGLSMFLVPKYLPDGNGAFTVRNTTSVGALEAKMGLHGKPTCVMNYDGATGWLVGEANRGLAAMFTMMNAERLMVGVHGISVASVAYQQAARYAGGRLQGRSSDGLREPVPIIEHADVRRMLLSIRGFVEASRALTGWTALQFDRALRHPDPVERKRADGFVALLTPVIKAAFTDLGLEATLTAQQVFGGHGFIRETGIEQYVRDCRAGLIYEGTNGVQAMDLVARKLALGGGAVVADFLDLMSADVDPARRQHHASHVAEKVGDALDVLRKVTDEIVRTDGDQAGAVATDYLRLFALVAMGWMWVRMIVAASGDSPLHSAKRQVGAFYADRLLAQIHGLATSIRAGGQSTMALPAEAF